MRRLICGASLILVLAFAAVWGGHADASDEKEPATIAEIMQALHKGSESPLATLKAALKSDSPDWSVVQKAAKVYVECSSDLPKNDPPKGDSESFKKLAKAFASNAKSLKEAAEKQELAAAKDAFGKIGGSCMGCHKAHKPD